MLASPPDLEGHGFGGDDLDDASPNEHNELQHEHISGYPKELDKAIKNAMFIAMHIDNADEFGSVRDLARHFRLLVECRVAGSAH